MNISIKESTEDDLDKLYLNWSLTIIGLAKESIKDWIEDLKQYIKQDIEEINIYVTSGALMNKKYNLRNNKAYKDDLNIVSIESNDIFNNLSKVSIERFSYQGRWFTDIVDNNK